MNMKDEKMIWARLSAITRNTMSTIGISTNNFTIGKCESNDLYFTCGRVAEYHCKIERIDDIMSGKSRFYLTNLCAQGTFVDEIKVSKLVDREHTFKLITSLIYNSIK